MILSRIPLINYIISQYYRWKYYYANAIPPGETHKFIAQSPRVLIIDRLVSSTIPKSANAIKIKPIFDDGSANTWFEVLVTNDNKRKVCVQLIALASYVRTDYLGVHYPLNQQQYLVFNNISLR